MRNAGFFGLILILYINKINVAKVEQCSSDKNGDVSVLVSVWQVTRSYAWILL